MKVLVTGGAGYIGSHTCLLLLEAGHEIVVIDNLCNSSVEAINRIKSLSGRDLNFIKCDLRDKLSLEKLFSNYEFDAVIHFAGLKSVSESVTTPLDYYDNNVTGTVNLLSAMNHNDVKKIVFSSSATVYGQPDTLPILETMPTSDAVNPYGGSKLIIENILIDLFASDTQWQGFSLRYFNPVGAHKSGMIGEDPLGLPNNLMPHIASAAIGRQEKVFVYGEDYDTSDGTGVRDYIHVMDLARGHVLALEKTMSNKGLDFVNLGTGKGYSVLEVIKVFEEVSQRKITKQITSRRDGDIGSCYADIQKAEELLGFLPEFGLREMCEDVWRWQSQNPNGYK